MSIFKKENTIHIVMPTCYHGEVEPENPKVGDIWQNVYTKELFVYLGDTNSKWFKVHLYENTEIIHKEELEQQEQEKATELQKYKDFFKTLNKLMNSN